MSTRETTHDIVNLGQPLAAGAVVVWLVPYALPLSADSLLVVHSVIFVASALIAIAMCLGAARVTLRHERAAWTLLGAGSVSMLLGDLVALRASGILRQPPPGAPSAQALLWIGAFVPYVIAFALLLQASGGGRLRRARRVTELALLVLLVTLILFTTVLYPLYGRGVDRSLTSSLMLFTSLAVSVSLLVYVAVTKPRLKPWQTPLFAALFIVCMASISDVAEIVIGLELGMMSASTGLPWYIGYVLVAIAGFNRMRYSPATPRNCSVVLNAVSLRWGTAISAAAFVLLPVFVYFRSRWTGDHTGGVLFSFLIAAATVVALARNLVIAMENSMLRRHATADPLTGLHNHRYFHERLDAEVARAQRTKGSLSVVAMDVDLFDRVNNVYGHSAGDQRLQSIARRLLAASRTADAVCRVGGDEFALIMADTDSIDAYKVCQRLLDYLREPDGVCPMPASMSMGIASMPEHARSSAELMQRADGALYWAKFHGRGQVVIYDTALVRTLGPEERITRIEEESYVNMVQLLSSAVDARDPYTHHHSRRVAQLSVALARDLGLDEEEVRALETAALLHDVGKIGVPDAVLRKPEQLTADERALVNEHPGLATRILAAIPRQEILPWIAAHHERWDGKGYPTGLSGGTIPLHSRIIALCDAYDAMTTDRPYRAARTPQEAAVEIEACAGANFDPDLTHRFVRLARAAAVETAS